MQLGRQLVDHLRAASFDAVWWTEAKLPISEDRFAFELVVLDLMLPGVYGLDWLTALRKKSDVPVLVLSARNDTLDKVRALKLGADDYMIKPFWPEELVERVRARLRRPTMRKDDSYESGPLKIDFGAHSVSANGEAVDLTRVEFDLLAALVRRSGQAVTRSWLVDHVLDSDRAGTERTLDVHVSRLRKKLGAQYIETVWGIGYRFKPEPT